MVVATIVEIIVQFIFEIMVEMIIENIVEMILEPISKCNKEKNTSLTAPGALAHRLQRLTDCKIQNGRQWAPKWPTGSRKVSTSRFLAF